MRRLCERPGCGGAASVSYGIDNDKLIVWIDSAPAVDPARAGTLCRRHADALSVPKGWSIDDRRQAIPMLFPTRDITPAQGVASIKTTEKSRLRSKRDVADIAVDPTLFEVGSPAVAKDISDIIEEVDAVVVETPPVHEPAAEADSLEDQDDPEGKDVSVLEETKAIPWTPRLVGSSDDDATAGIKKGRLLGRAFGERPRKTADE